MATDLSSTNRHDAHATTEQGSGWSTKRIAITALFCAVAAICSFFEGNLVFIPGTDFLKYDPSGIIALIAGYAFGPVTGVVVGIVSYLPHIAQSGIYGVVMAIIATLSMVLPASLVYKRNTTFKGALLGMVVGAVVCLACCIGANLIVTPIYMHESVQTVVDLIVPVLLPFNVAKIVINCVITALAYKPISKALGN